MPAYRVIARGIAHVPENRRLFPKLTIEENLRIGAYLPQARKHFGERLGSPLLPARLAGTKLVLTAET